MAAPLRGITASQADQPLFDISLDLDLGWTGRLGSWVQGGRKAFGDEALPHPFDGPQADTQGIPNARVGKLLVVGVGEEQDTGMGQPARRSFARRQQEFQGSPFFCCQGDAVLFQGETPAFE